MQREGSFREMKRHVHYEKPSEKRARQKAEAVRRARKLARKRAQREGLIAAPKKPVAPLGRVSGRSARPEPEAEGERQGGETEQHASVHSRSKTGWRAAR